MSEEQNKPPKYGGFIKKNPKLGALILVIAGIWVLYYSSVVYTKISLLEQGMGTEVRVPRFIVVLYEVLGIWGVTLFFVFSGLYLFYLAYDVYKTLIKK